MSKAEEFAYSKYPKDKKGVLYDLARNSIIQGYHQAEKDLELSWEDVYGILYSERIVMREWFSKHKDVADDDSNEIFCKEVLERFKDYKHGSKEL